MKKLMILLIVALGVMIFASCEKISKFNQENPQNPNNPGQTSVKLFYSSGEKGEKGEIVSGQTIYTDSLYKTIFHMSPAEGDTIAIGIYTIATGNLNLLQTSPINGIAYKFPHGTYTMNVTGINIGNISFNNITVISGNQTPPIPNTEATFPIRIYDFVVNNDNITLKIRANISQWGNISSNQFDYVKRVDANNWTTGSVNKINDSLMFQLTIPKINGSFIEFNVRYMPQNNWLTPSYGNPPSILYNGTGIPYSDSHSYFGFKLVQNGNNWELRTFNNVLILTNIATSEPIPGNYGDEAANNYQVRWAGNKIFFRTTSSTVRYKIDNGSWIYTAAINSSNSNYKYCVQNIPIGNTTKVVTTQWGNGSNSSNFIASSNEILISSFANPTPSDQGISVVVYQ